MLIPIAIVLGCIDFWAIAIKEIGKNYRLKNSESNYESLKIEKAMNLTIMLLDFTQNVSWIGEKVPFSEFCTQTFRRHI